MAKIIGLWTGPNLSKRGERISDEEEVESSSNPDKRTSFERDRDRILYSSYFRRLSLITQVISPMEGYDFHNRLTHVLKVAQIGLRTAEKLRREYSKDVIESHGGLEPEVVEAACLAHDLGHPPFGHAAEEELTEQARKYAGLKSFEGFEGNAQSFRIVTRLEKKYLRSTSGKPKDGLDLTRATLCALLKYPWKYDPHSDKESKKWGVYRDDVDTFKWAREGLPVKRLTLEAQLMDWADDISYSVHDMEDFYRGDRIPLHRLAETRKEGGKKKLGLEFERLMEGIIRRKKLAGAEKDRWENQASLLFENIPVRRRFERDRTEQRALAFYASHLITTFIDAATLTSEGLTIDPEIRLRVNILKELTWQYVIEGEPLASQQLGQRRVIETLFQAYFDAADKGGNKLNLFPERYRADLRDVDGVLEDKVRIVMDFISSLTEQQALALYQRITGIEPGSIFGVSL